MPRARSRRVINRANSIIIAGAGKRRYIRIPSFSLSLFLSRNHSRGHSRNTSAEKHSQSHTVHRATPYPRPTLHSKNTPGCLPVDKITAISYTVVFSPAFFHLLSRERYNIQFVGHVHARRRLRSAALLRPRARTRRSTYITLTYICMYI